MRARLSKATRSSAQSDYYHDAERTSKEGAEHGYQAGYSGSDAYLRHRSAEGASEHDETGDEYPHRKSEAVIDKQQAEAYLLASVSSAA